MVKALAFKVEEKEVNPLEAKIAAASFNAKDLTPRPMSSMQRPAS